MKKRIISAIIALIIVIPLIVFGGIPFAIGAGVLALLAYKEVIDLKGNKIPNLVKFLGAVILLLLIYMNYADFSFLTSYAFGTVALLVLIMLIPLVFYKEDKYNTKDAMFLTGFILILGMFFNSLILIVNTNIWYLVFLLSIPILTDIFAYIVGILIGKHKLIPSISPNKTWEGSIGGSIVGTVIPTILYVTLINNQVKMFWLILIVLVLSIVGQIGDLFFSKIKRENNIKDFSNIMPGHGGILDRLDSIIFVVLAFMVIFPMI